MSYPQLPEPVREPTSAELAARNDPQVGVAHSVSVRTEGGSRESLAWTVLNFRVHQQDAAGRDLPPTSVEMRGRVLNGMVAEGDLIRLPNQIARGGVLQLKSVQNLTANSAVTVRSSVAPVWLQITLIVVVLGIFLVVFGVIAVSMMGMFRAPF